MKKQLLTTFGCLLAWIFVQGQVVTYTPQFPTMTDSIEIIFNASQGNGALNGVAQVYMHTGLISENSWDESDWKHRINPWPTGDPDLVIVDSLVDMTPLGNNLHRIKIKPSSYYGSNSLIDYNALAFVFRNQNGTLAGKTATNGDIFIPVFKSANFDAMFFQPLVKGKRYALNSSVNVEVLTNASANIRIFHDGVQVAQTASNGTALTTSINANAFGKHWIRLEATAGTTTVIDSVYYLVEQPAVDQNPPFASQNGINYINNSTVLLQLNAPNKSSVYVIGDFNNWQIDPNYRMTRTLDGTAFWIELSGLTPGQEYRYQYLVDQKLVVADPWADKYLDEFNDFAIFTFTYPNLIDYPSGFTHGMVSVFQPGQTPYVWQNQTFNRPWRQDLVIYELLIRDFQLRHDYQSLIDSLDYLERLGVNVIQLMPINEFDGNQSWGYSPAFHAAPDKYYGPKNDLKQFIDECHSRGIAVVLDVVFNHAFGQNSMARLYMDENSNKPTPDNPWFNDYVPHPYGFYNDFDHSSLATQYVVDRVLYYWLTEFKFDGFRFDLSKGFTQINSYPNNLGLWANYDPDRVYWLKRIYNQVRTFDSDCYMILEHFADNSEELELSNHGFMIWGNAHGAYKQAALGYQTGSDFRWAVSSKDRGWPFQNLVGYMESHDEERIMYECLNYGNMNVNGPDTLYNIRDLSTALKRIELISAFFYTVPGPKMLWQFGELGYDFSINFGGRTNPKPIRWNYYMEPERQRLYKATAAMIKLKTDNIAFRTSTYDLDVWGTGKRMWVSDPSMNVTVIGNIGVDSLNTMMPGFQHTGPWYDYMTGDTFIINNVNDPIPLGPGDYHIFTDVKLPPPDLTVPVGVESPTDGAWTEGIESMAYPNPFNEEIVIRYTLPDNLPVQVCIYDALGRTVKHLVDEPQMSGRQFVVWDGLRADGQPAANGFYYYVVTQGQHKSSKQILKAN